MTHRVEAITSRVTLVLAATAAAAATAPTPLPEGSNVVVAREPPPYEHPHTVTSVAPRRPYNQLDDVGSVVTNRSNELCMAPPGFAELLINDSDPRGRVLRPPGATQLTRPNQTLLGQGVTLDYVQVYKDYGGYRAQPQHLDGTVYWYANPTPAKRNRRYIVAVVLRTSTVDHYESLWELCDCDGQFAHAMAQHDPAFRVGNGLCSPNRTAYPRCLLNGTDAGDSAPTRVDGPDGWYRIEVGIVTRTAAELASIIPQMVFFPKAADKIPRYEIADVPAPNNTYVNNTYCLYVNIHICTYNMHNYYGAGSIH